MALQPPATATFPDQQQILAYINAHPARDCIETLPPKFQEIAVIAEAFANRNMSRKEIGATIKQAFLSANKEALEQKALIHAHLIGGATDTSYLTHLLDLYPKIENQETHLPIKIYKIFLKDLADKMSYTFDDRWQHRHDYNAEKFRELIKG
jgi:hypothetical protein